MSGGAASTGTGAASIDIQLRDSRVLIVDDSKFNRQILARFVGWAGVHNIEFAVDGIDGLEKVASFKPDLVLVDFGMPRMGGIEMTQKIRQDPELTDLPVLIQTTLNSDQQRVTCFKAGATDILSKPVNPGECMARVRLHLEKLLLLREMRKFRERIESELKLAASMQKSLVPDDRKVKKIIAHGRSFLGLSDLAELDGSVVKIRFGESIHAVALLGVKQAVGEHGIEKRSFARHVMLCEHGEIVFQVVADFFP